MIPEAAALSVPAWIQLTAIVVGFCGVVLAPTLAIIVSSKIATGAAQRAAKAVEAVAKKLDESDAKTAKKLDSIHFLVDGSLSEAKDEIKRLERRLFDEGLGDEPLSRPLPAVGPPFPSPGPAAPVAQPQP